MAEKLKPQFDLEEIPESSRQVLLSIIHYEANEYLKQPGMPPRISPSPPNSVG